MAELTISAADIASALKKNLEGFEPSLEARTVGRVAEVGDGIARVHGLPDAAVNELLEFEDGSVGLALNLDEDSIGAVVLGEASHIEEGQTVKATGRILSVPSMERSSAQQSSLREHYVRRVAPSHRSDFARHSIPASNRENITPNTHASVSTPHTVTLRIPRRRSRYVRRS